ncbi:MAG: hypothetical protein VX641_05210 [Planctomycetota bacterium]|nr:hypothetical protein [Planctomycetota bacterium]
MNITTTTLATLVLAASPLIADSFMLLDTDGSVRPVQITNIGPTGIEVIDSEDGFTTLSRDDCIAFLRPVPYPTRTNRPTIHLHDGQSLPGRMKDGSDGDHIIWEHAWIGDLNIPVDRIDRIVLNGASTPRATDSESDSDTIRLLNGDVVEGFVTSVSPLVRIETDSESVPVQIEIHHDRISEIDLFGERVESPDPMVWSNDGTVVHLPTIGVGVDGHLVVGRHMYASDARVEMEPGPHLQSIHTISFSGSGIHPLGTLDIISSEGPETRMIIPSPHTTDPSAPLELSPVEFRGPLTIRYRIPEGRYRLRATIRMPASASRWGDCDLAILVDGVERHHCLFNSDQLEHTVDVMVSGDVLEFRLGEGANGPVQDHIRFEYGVLLPADPSPVRTFDETLEGSE